MGSIKTIIGHTEGSAGLAGVMKASLAVQHGVIPANLHFENLNPKIRPFYEHLRVPTATSPWPSLPKGAPRRVSVNSFGFGGTNSHAIIESWDGYGCDPAKDATSPPKSVGNGGSGSSLFVLSANSGQALATRARALAGYLREHPDTALDRLAYTLFRRGSFPFRAAFSATSVEQLLHKLEASVEGLRDRSRTTSIPESLPVRILGIFTGQGAQWATMGKELYGASEVFRRTLSHMQRSLDSLPERDRPDWSLLDELSAPKETSRIGTAAISQPLCTALQVSLVDVLHAAGVEFAAVVGHSSGEIAAAYAAGYLDAHDAVRIAYYRGVHSRLAQGPGGQRGKMMAVGMSLEEATSFCRGYGKRLTVAASNSDKSCTLAGDADAVEEARSRLQDETFVRILAVDTAYHSHHMQSCAEPYLESIRQCGGIKVRKGARKCIWYSSVWGPEGFKRSFDDEDCPLLEGQYWVENLTSPVLFSQALHRAVTEEHCFDLVLEVGPHPALKGPSSETIVALTGVSLPYTGVLNRGKNAVEAFADAMGLAWQLFPSPRPMVSFEGMSRAFLGGDDDGVVSQKPVLMKDLPVYPWDHENIFWKEPKASWLLRHQSQPPHELLGHAEMLGENDRREIHWRQVLKLNELPWLRGHRIQGEVLFPASGYLSMAYEAAVRLINDDQQQAVRLVELHDIDLVRPMQLEEDSTGLEIRFTVRVTSQSDTCISAQVACYSGAVDAHGQLDHNSQQAGIHAHFSGGVRLWLGQAQENTLPPRTQPLLPLDSLHMEQFYSSLSGKGYGYSGAFQAPSMLRRLDQAVVTLPPPPETSTLRTCMHPSPLDTVFQGLLAAFSFPGDGRLHTTYLPTHIDCVRISMEPSVSQSAPIFTADTVVTSGSAISLRGDVDLFDARDAHTEVQMRGIVLTALGQHKDRWLYANETWIRDAASGIEPSLRARLSPEDQVLGELLMRTAYCYYRRLREEIKPSELETLGKYQRHLMKWILEHVFPQIEAGEHPDIRPEYGWENDTLQDLEHLGSPYLAAGNIDMHLLHAVGQKLPDIVRGIVPPLQVLMQDNMVERLYIEGLGVEAVNNDIGVLAKQLTCRYPRMRVLEVGAGTGGATRSVLATIGDHYASYTYTDISVGFFEKARGLFKDESSSSKASFKTLNIENDPVAQGFGEGAFDMIVASNVLHATRRLAETMQNCRRLLRPGGFLVLVEITDDNLPMQLYMSTLPGWFLGIDDGRVWAPTISVDQWDTLLKSTGFSGVETSTTPSFCSVMMSRATDDRVQVLQEPLAVPSQSLPRVDGEIMIIGGSSGGDGVSELPTEMQSILSAATGAPATVQPALEGLQVPPGAAVLCLCDLDSPIFCGMNEARFKGLQEIMQNADIVLWVTYGALSGKKAEASITVGLGRTALVERSDLRLQFLDVDDLVSATPSTLAAHFLRLACIGQSEWDEVQWTHEPELVLRDGGYYIPRVLALDTINRRSAARNRKVSQTTRLGGTSTAVELSEQGTLELQASPPVGALRDDDRARVKVMASSFGTLDCDEYGPSYLCVGLDLASGEKVLALSCTNSSLVMTAKDRVLYRWAKSEMADNDDNGENDSSKLSLFLTRLQAESILRNLKSPIWIHGGPEDLSQAIALVAQEQNSSVFQSTSDHVASPSSCRTFIHPYANGQALHKMCPKGLRTLINLGSPRNESLWALMRANLPASTTVLDSKTLTLKASRWELVQLARQHFRQDFSQGLQNEEVLSIQQLSSSAEMASQLGPRAVIDWYSAEDVTAMVRPLDHHRLFAPDRTYLLFGMGGDMGISVCKWMVDHGAQNVVLVSRTPKVSPDVIDFMSQQGATVRVMAVDITDLDALRAAFADIKSTMRPVGGVINGAMVLRDRMFVNMSWTDFAAVLAPKLQGTQNLDELFGDNHPELEFFIALSSTMTVVGNIGQSAYNAANLAMTSLIRQRRQRGLPGSVVVLAVMSGFGYVFRTAADHAATLQETGFARAVRESETELHEMLAEAIVCGQLGSDQPVELITGLETSYEVPRRRDLRLSCFFTQQNNSGPQQATDKASGNNNTSVGAQLLAAKEPAQCLSVLEKCFTQALGKVLEFDPDQMDRDLPVASLGIDSLVAVRIREWFLEEVGVDVSVLKILSTSYSISRLCEDVLVDWRRLRKVPEEVEAMNGTVNGAMTPVKSRVDWSAELAGFLDKLPSLIPQGLDAESQPPRSHGLRVILTGSTGFLGTHILRNLVADPRIAEIHCVAVRARRVRVHHIKVREYQGDLSKPLLGLSADDFTRLAQITDVIIHLGADVNLLKSYDALRDANLGSTQILLAMATPRQIPFHYVSSSAVALLQEGSTELAETSVSSFSPPPDPEAQLRPGLGYATCKWMAEMLLEGAPGHVPTAVHRFVNIMGLDAPEEHYLVALDRYCTRMRAVPALDPERWLGELDMMDVEELAPAFVTRVLDVGGQQRFSVHNYCSGGRYNMSNLAEMYREKLGGDVDVWPLDKWLRKATEMGMGRGVESSFIDTGYVVQAPVLLQGKA